MEVEIHVSSALEVIPQLGSRGRARVAHIVIRLDVPRSKREEPKYADAIASIQGPTAALFHLRTVTLETTDEADSAELVDKLALLSSSGKLRRRTCREAQQIAQVASRDPAGYDENQGVISPLWYSDEYSRHQREKWYVNAL